MTPCCFLCGLAIRVWPNGGWRNWVCPKCAGELGLDVSLSEWPEWARAFVNHERTERRREQQRIAAGVEFVPLDEVVELGQSAGE